MVWRDHGHRHTLSSKFSVDSNGISSLSPISEDYASCMLSMICWELLGLGWSNLHWLVLLDPPKRSIGRYDQHQSSRLHNSLANARKGFTFQWHWQRPCTVAFCEKVSWQFFYSTLEQSSNTFSACPFMIMEVYILPKIPCDKVHSLSDNAKAMPYRRPPRKSGNTLFSTIGSCGSAHTIHHLDIQIPTINGPKDVWPTLWGPCLHDVAKYTCCCNSCSCSGASAMPNGETVAAWPTVTDLFRGEPWITKGLGVYHLHEKADRTQIPILWVWKKDTRNGIFGKMMKI